MFFRYLRELSVAGYAINITNDLYLNILLSAKTTIRKPPIFCYTAPMKNFPYKRIVIIGTTGSGKSTLGGKIEQQLGIPVIIGNLSVPVVIETGQGNLANTKKSPEAEAPRDGSN